MTRPETSGTSSLSVRGRTVPSLVTDSATSSSATTWTRTPGGAISGGRVSTTGRLRIMVTAASPARPSNTSGSTACSMRTSVRFMVPPSFN